MNGKNYRRVVRKLLYHCYLLQAGSRYSSPNVAASTVKRIFCEHQIFAEIAKLNTHEFLELPITMILCA